MGLPVSSLASSLQFFLTTSKKLSNLKNQRLFSALLEKWGHRANPCPQNWRDRRIYLENHNMNHNCGNQYWSRKTWTAIHKLLEAQCRQIWARISRGTQSWGESTYFYEFTSSSSTQWIQEKYLIVLWQRKGKGNHFKIYHSILFLARSALRRNDLTRTYVTQRKGNT